MSPVRIRYQTIEFGEISIHLCTLRDLQQFHDPHHKARDLGINSTLWPLFGLVWPSSIVMSHFLLDYDFQDKRILEVGCGIGLASILLNHLSADITATDYHPEVEGFLDRNTQLNQDKKIPFLCADWISDATNLGRFDLVIGSDLLYESEHAAVLSRFILRHAKKNCDVIIVDPGRGEHGKFGRAMAEAGFSCTKSKPATTEFLNTPFKGFVLEYHRDLSVEAE